MASTAPETVVTTDQPEIHQRPKLLTIPRELRDMIIAPLLQSGDLSILCVCPAITEEALQSIKKEATFRVNFNVRDRENTAVGGATVPSDIQNVEIRFQLPPGGDLKLEEAFSLSSIGHLGYREDGAMGRCTITIDYDGGASFDLLDLRLRAPPDLLVGRITAITGLGGPRVLPMLLHALSGYTHFNSVIVNIVRGSMDDYWKCGPEVRLCIDRADARLLKRDLVPALGPADFTNDGGHCSLAFHPREHTKSKQKDM
ncbi:hypothetical protein IMSHALPRED_003974 [Imshaugia aleurites]|uniref:Uncharacterized protein n=1 Tax=Imshaugia aleurites TaxID=172621 RepID=A0A8H3EKM8_9LECA|nr:hypothetical protein IMSHALPRED_003974 [Imshaugia aleurites]